MVKEQWNSMHFDFDLLLDAVSYKGKSLLVVTKNKPFFGMEIESVEQTPKRIKVETTGAIYHLKKKKLDMYRKIDPAKYWWNFRSSKKTLTISSVSI